MKNHFYSLLMLLFPAAVPAFATVSVTSPSNAVMVGASAQYAAAASSPCRLGVATMGIYVDDQLRYTSNGATLNKILLLATGAHKTYVQEWDYCGGTSGTPVEVTATNQSGVYVSLPTAGTTVSSGNVSFVASATTTCTQGVATMGLYVNDQLLAVTPGAVLNQTVSLTSGLKRAVVQAWDNCGGSTKQQLQLEVQDAAGVASIANTFTGIQAVANWNQWGELAPVYDICDPCEGITWNMQQHVSNISLSGNATRFDISGFAPYGDVLWSNKLVGQATTENLPDNDHKILPAVHHLQYDADVFVTNLSVTQDLEFDVNMFFGGTGMEWGTECNNLNGADWDVWDNVNARWVSTGAPCHLIANTWNHVTLEVERLADNSLLYKTVTLNGSTAILNRTYPPFKVPSVWYGMTVNFQMDGDYKMSANTAYLDNLTVKYW